MEIFNSLKDVPSIRAAIISITSASTGSLLDLLKVDTVDQALQRAAWTIAILAGIVAICNGVKNWFHKRKPITEEEADYYDDQAT